MFLNVHYVYSNTCVAVDLKCIAHFAKEAGKGVGIVTNQYATRFVSALFSAGL